VSGISDAREVGKSDATDLLAQGVFMFVAQGLQEVSFGRGITAHRVGHQAFDIQMQIALVLDESGGAEANGIAIHFHAREIKRVIAQFDGMAAPGRIDVVGIALQADRGLARHGTFGAPKNARRKVSASTVRMRSASVPAAKRSNGVCPVSP